MTKVKTVRAVKKPSHRLSSASKVGVGEDPAACWERQATTLRSLHWTLFDTNAEDSCSVSLLKFNFICWIFPPTRAACNIISAPGVIIYRPTAMQVVLSLSANWVNIRIEIIIGSPNPTWFLIYHRFLPRCFQRRSQTFPLLYCHWMLVFYLISVISCDYVLMS